jgi:hypothetical protein
VVIVSRVQVGGGVTSSESDANGPERARVTVLVMLTTDVGPDSVTAIIIHVTDAEDFKTEINKSTYDAMDSAVTSAIFSTLPDSELTTASETENEDDSDSEEGNSKASYPNGVCLGFS